MVSPCLAAFFLSLTALDMPRSTQILGPAFTFAAVPSAVLHADFCPILAEVDKNYRIDLTDFKTKLDRTHAVQISHIGDRISNMNMIITLCQVKKIQRMETPEKFTKWSRPPYESLNQGKRESKNDDQHL